MRLLLCLPVFVDDSKEKMRNGHTTVTDVPGYAAVEYHDLYPGAALVSDDAGPPAVLAASGRPGLNAGGHAGRG